MSIKKTIWRSVVLLALAGVPLPVVADELAPRVVIVANSREPESVQLAAFYAGQRGIPPANIITLPLPGAEDITWREFIDQVYQPLQDELYRRGWLAGTASSLFDRLGRRRYAPAGHHISYLVVCRGVPLRITNDPALVEEKSARKFPPQFDKNEAAVDSELSLLAQSGYETTGFLPNPLFENQHPSALDADTVVKVSRLDGPTYESARRLVTSAIEGERRGLLGRYYVDLQGPHPDGDRWLGAARRQLDELGFDGDVEPTGATFPAAARFDAPVLYFGWYADSLNGPFAVPGFVFPAGAVALHIHSFSARTLHSDSVGWCGPVVARGVTATVGNVFEPYLQLTHRPDLLLHALIQGQTFGDAAYYALPALSWQAVAIGDPLYRPFKVSLEEQERMVAQLPPALAPYAVVRRANLLLLQHQTTEARARLAGALKQQTTLPVGLALAKLELGENDSASALRAFGFVSALKAFTLEEWPLAREAAAVFASHGERAAALLVYAGLIRSAAPSVDARKALLAEAQAVAAAAGDLALASDYALKLRELSPPMAK